MCRIYVASLLMKCLYEKFEEFFIKEGDTYDSSRKKSTEIFKGICTINIWNQRLGQKKSFYALFTLPSFKHFAHT